jgi:uncharacterized membrane protein
MNLSPFLLAFLQSSTEPQPPQFFTIQTLFTAAGTTTAVITVTSVLHSLFEKLPARWFAFVFSLFLTFTGIAVRHEPYNAANILLAIINGLVVYAAAVGVNNITTARPAGGAAAPAAPAGGRSYRWWP